MIGVAPETYLQYDWQGRTINDHRAEIRKLFDFRESTVADGEQMKQWLIAEVLPQEHQDERQREEAYGWFLRMHLEAPSFAQPLHDVGGMVIEAQPRRPNNRFTKSGSS